MRAHHAQANGAAFESLIEYSNRVYEIHGLAVVNKREIPVVIERRDSRGKVIGHLVKPSQVDYEGFLKGGRSIQFEAKSTSLETRFELKQLEDHQVTFLRSCVLMGALSFVLIEFSKLREIYFVPAAYVVDRFTEWKTPRAVGTGKASIGIADIRERGIRVTSGNGVPVDYLAAVRRYFVI